MSDPTPFKVEWTAAQVGGVLEKVRAYRFPPAPVAADGWAYGCDADFLKALCGHWTQSYEWRAAVADLNRFPQFTARVEDFDLHFVHVVGEAGGKRPLLLSHGWPGSHFEFWASIEKLAFPSRFGGDPADAFDLVIPSLPGFGFSSKPTRPFGQRGTARLFNRLMTEVLGYATYLAQGGDWGAVVTSWLGFDHGAHARAIHLNMLAFRPKDGPVTDEELDWAARAAAAAKMKTAYQQLQITRPQSIAWMAADNPVGQAAWIVERFHDWADLREKTLTEAFPMDHLLTNVMLYVMTGAFTTGAWYYRGLVEEDAFSALRGRRCETPTAFAAYPGEALSPPPPRSYAERVYNISRWSEMPRGGHFAAMEEPDLFVEDVRAWGREAG